MYLSSVSTNIPYQTFGEGQHFITLLNGFMRPQRDFLKLTKHLSAAGFHCITMDFRGSGEHTVSTPFTICDLADDVRNVWEQLGVRESALLGISMGGMVAQQLIADTPDSLSHVFLISTTRDQDQLKKPSPDWSQGSEIVLGQYVSEYFRARHEILLKAMGKAMDKMWTSEDKRVAAELQRQAIQNWSPPSYTQSPKPSLSVLHGSEDQIFPLQSAQHLAEHFSAPLHTFMGHGHLLLAETPSDLIEKVVSQAVLTFG